LNTNYKTNISQNGQTKIDGNKLKKDFYSAVGIFANNPNMDISADREENKKKRNSVQEEVSSKEK